MQVKHTFLVMILLVVVLSIPTTGLAAVNLIRNAGFEEPVSDNVIPGWVLFTGDIGTTITVDEGTAYSGTKALVFHDTSNAIGAGLRSEPIPAKPGEWYGASVWVHCDPGSRVFLYIDFWDANRQRIATKTVLSSLSGVWEQLGVEGEAPEGTAMVSIILFSQVANVGVSRWDDATLYKLSDEFAAAVGGTTQVVDPLTGQTVINRLRNSGFEAPTTDVTIPGWVTFAGTIGDVMRVEEGLAYAGNKALVIRDMSGTVSAGLRSDPMPAKPGEWYETSVWVYNEPGSRGYLYLDFWDVNRRRISAKSVQSKETGRWEQLRVDAEAPEGTEMVSVILFSQAVNIGVSYWDDVVLYSISEQFTTSEASEEILEVVADVETLDYAPADLSVVTTNPPAFVWIPVPAAASYTLQLSTDPAFSTASTMTVEGIKLSLLRPSFTLDPEKTWYWRVFAVDKNGQTSAPTSTRSFNLAPNAVTVALPDLNIVRRRIPASHPRLFVTPDTLATWRAGIADNMLMSALWRGINTDAIIATLEPLPGEPPNPRPGGVFNEEIWSQANRITENALQKAELLSMAYLMTGNPQMGEAARRWIMHIASWNPSGNTSARTNSDSSRPILQRLSRAYTWAYDALTPEDRKKVQEVMRVRGNDWYQILRNLPYESKPYASHPTAALSVLGECAIAFMGEISEAEEWFDYIVNIHFTIYPPWGSDPGGWSEGHAYWNTSFGRTLWFADALKAAVGLDLYQLPFFRNTGYFKMYTQPPYSKMGPFGDHAYQGPTSGSASAMGHLANVYQDEYFKWYAQSLGVSIQMGLTGFIRANLYDPTTVKAVPPEDPPTGVYYADIGWVVFHRDYLAPDKERLQFMFKSSPYGSYSHSMADQNSFTLEAYGEPLAISSGYRPWYGSPHHIGWTKTTQAQNAILVDGFGQVVQSLQAKGMIIDYLNGETFSYTAGEAHTAYPAGLLDRYVRHVVYLRPDLFVLFDDIQAPKKSTYSWLFHAYHPVEIHEDGQGFLLSAPKASLNVKLLSHVPLSYSQTDQFAVPLDKEMDMPVQWHLTAITQEPAASGYFLAVLEPLLAGEQSRVAVEAITLANGEGVRLSDAAQTSLVLFRRKAGELKTPELISDAAVAAWRQEKDGEQGVLMAGGKQWQAQSGLEISSDTTISVEFTVSDKTISGSVKSDAAPGSQPLTMVIKAPGMQDARVTSTHTILAQEYTAGELRLRLAPGEHEMQIMWQ